MALRCNVCSLGNIGGLVVLGAALVSFVTELARSQDQAARAVGGGPPPSAPLAFARRAPLSLPVLRDRTNSK